MKSITQQEDIESYYDAHLCFAKALHSDLESKVKQGNVVENQGSVLLSTGSSQTGTRRDAGSKQPQNAARTHCHTSQWRNQTLQCKLYTTCTLRKLLYQFCSILQNFSLNIDEFKSRLQVLSAKYDPDYQPKNVFNHDFSFSAAYSHSALHHS